MKPFPEWNDVAIDGLPKSGVPVTAALRNSQGNWRRIRAQYAAPNTLPLDFDAGDAGTYDETTDTYYCSEGWYETNEYEETHWEVSDPVLYWMELPPLPPVTTIDADRHCSVCGPEPIAFVKDESQTWPSVVVHDRCRAAFDKRQREAMTNFSVTGVK